MSSETNDIQIIRKFSQDYEDLGKIGEGGYGTVHKVKNLSTGEITAIKTYNFEKNSNGIDPTIIREISILKSLDHENIVKFKRVNFQASKIEMELEYCYSDLNKEIYQGKGYNFDQKLDPNYDMNFIRNVLYQILRGMSKIHSSMILHRDLKPSNLFLTSKGDVKIGDFGLSRVFAVPNKLYSKYISTLWYTAPELFIGCDFYSTGVDIWSIGCIFGELLCMTPFFVSDNEFGMMNLFIEIFGNFLSGDQKILPGSEFFEKYSIFGNIFVNSIPQYGPKGLGLQNYLRLKSKFPITYEIFDLLNRMLQVDPTKRISCIDALNHPFFHQFKKQ